MCTNDCVSALALDKTLQDTREDLEIIRIKRQIMILSERQELPREMQANHSFHFFLHLRLRQIGNTNYYYNYSRNHHHTINQRFESSRKSTAKILVRLLLS